MGKSQSHTSEPFTVKGVEKYATFEDDWFAKGASRYAYQGKIYSVNGWWFERGERCVVKLYKKEFCNILKEEAWKADDRASSRAHEMAGPFNKEHRSKGVARIEILIPIISEVETFATYKRLGRDPVPKTVRGSDAQEKENADEMVPKDASVAIEHFLQGRYVEFVSNSSFVNPDEDTVVPVAFSHFTYHESNGDILVTDLQGVHNQKSYIFTDPAIHSTEKHGKKFGYYGPTDLGVYGVMKFFMNHECNELCRGLLKPDTSSIPSHLQGDLNLAIEAIQARSGSSYSFDLQNCGLTAKRLQELHREIARALAQSISDRAAQKIKRGLTWAMSVDWKHVITQAATAQWGNQDGASTSQL